MTLYAGTKEAEDSVKKYFSAPEAEFEIRRDYSLDELVFVNHSNPDPNLGYWNTKISISCASETLQWCIERGIKADLVRVFYDKNSMRTGWYLPNDAGKTMFSLVWQ